MSMIEFHVQPGACEIDLILSITLQNLTQYTFTLTLLAKWIGADSSQKGAVITKRDLFSP